MNAPTTLQIAAFLKRRLPAMRTASRQVLTSLIDWHTRVGGCGVLRKDGRIVAVALARCVGTTAEAEADRWAHREGEDGKIIWVQHIVSLHPRGIGLLLAQAAQRFGRREVFAGHVYSRDGQLRMLPWNVVERLFTENIPEHEFTRSVART
jgi:hypothetical protein